MRPKIDWGNPLTKDLQILLPLGIQLQGLGHRDYPVISDDSTTIGTPEGLARDYQNTSGGTTGIKTQYGDVDFANGATALTTVLFLRADANTGTVSIWRKSNQCNIQMLGSKARCSVWVSGGTGVREDGTTTENFPTGRFITFVHTWASGEGHEFWWDGVSQSLSLNETGTGSVDNSANGLAIGGRDSVNGEGFDGAIFYAAQWTRKLSSAEILSVTNNPWQLFKPRLMFAHVARYDPTAEITAPLVGETLTITLVDAAGTALTNLTGLSWAWFDQNTPDTAVAPVDQGTGETTDGSGVLSIELPNTTLTTGQTGSLALMDSTGMIYSWYRITL